VHLYQPPSPPPPPPPHDLPALPVVQPSDQVGSQSTASWCIPPQYFVDHASHAYANVVATPTTAWPVQTTHTTMAPPIYQRSQDIVQPPPIYQHPQDDAQVAALYHHQRHRMMPRFLPSTHGLKTMPSHLLSTITSSHTTMSRSGRPIQVSPSTGRMTATTFRLIPSARQASRKGHPHPRHHPRRKRPKFPPPLSSARKR